MSRPSKLKKPSTLFAELFSRVSEIKDILARPFGISTKSVGAWARPVASDENPFGSGNASPMNRMEKVIVMTHVYDPVMAREFAEWFPRLVDELDWLAGISEADEEGNPCRLLAKVSAEHLEIVQTLLGDCSNPRKLSEALDKTRTLKTYVIQLQACIEQVLKPENEGKGSQN